MFRKHVFYICNTLSKHAELFNNNNVNTILFFLFLNSVSQTIRLTRISVNQPSEA